MAEHDKDSLSKAIEYAVDTMLVGKDSLDEVKLARVLYERLRDKHNT